jgi:hypothetical protein
MTPEEKGDKDKLSLRNLHEELTRQTCMWFYRNLINRKGDGRDKKKRSQPAYL